MNITHPSVTPTATATSSIPLRSTRGRWIIAATAIGSGMIFLDTTVVNVALARIQAELGAPLAGLQWIVNAYMLFLASLLLLGGSLGDAYGRTRVFASGLVLFTLASAACGLAPSLAVLIAARAFQGIGGALLVPGSLAMIKAVIAPEDSNRAIGLWSGLAGVTSAAGPLLGGWLVQAVSWRMIFFLNVPLALITLWALRQVPPSRDEDAPAALDWRGAGAAVIGLGGLTYGLIEGPQNGWSNPVVIAALVVGVAGLLLFPLIERLESHPMVPLATWRSADFSGANGMTLGVYFALTGVLLFFVLDLQQIQGYSPLQAGLSLLPLTVLLLVLSPRIGGLVGRVGARPLMIGGPVLVAAGFLALLHTGTHAVYLRDIFPSIALVGLGMSLLITPLVSTVLNAVPPGLAGAASGINNMVSRVAGLLATAILGLVVAVVFQEHLRISVERLHLPASARAALLAHSDRLADDPIPAGLSPAAHQAIQAAIAQDYLAGFRWAMAICAALCLLSAALAVGTIGRRSTTL